MTRRARICCVDDEPGMLEVCHDALIRIGDVDIETFSHPHEALTFLRESGADVMVTDIQMPGLTGIELINAVRDIDAELPVVMITGFPSVETAVEAMRLGVADYVTKPFHPDDLMRTVARQLELRRLREENRWLREHIEGAVDHELITADPAMQAVLDTVARVAPTDVDVLIHGETGTGKELIARALHRASRRTDGPFVPVNCGAIPDGLIEAELFGYERGAFTGADQRRIGLLEYAAGGTLFLDEIADLPLSMQARLLRVLQERTFRRLGGHEEIPFDARVVSACATDLRSAVRDGTFREDLYYRLDVVTIELPPLRERRADIELLARHFLTEASHESGRKLSGLSDDAVAALRAYPWPGNVRELQNVIRRSAALGRHEVLTAEDLPEHILEAPLLSGEDGRGEYHDLRRAWLNRFERQYLQRLLRRHRGNVAAAAKEAGLPRGSLYRLLNRHHIDPIVFRVSDD